MKSEEIKKDSIIICGGIQGKVLLVGKESTAHRLNEKFERVGKGFPSRQVFVEYINPATGKKARGWWDYFKCTIKRVMLTRQALSDIRREAVNQFTGFGIHLELGERELYDGNESVFYFNRYKAGDNDHGDLHDFVQWSRVKDQIFELHGSDKVLLDFYVYDAERWLQGNLLVELDLRGNVSRMWKTGKDESDGIPFVRKYIKVKTLQDLREDPRIDQVIMNYDGRGRHMIECGDAWHFEYERSIDIGNVAQLCEMVNDNLTVKPIIAQRTSDQNEPGTYCTGRD